MRRQKSPLLIQSKEIGNNKYYEEQQNLKNDKVRSVRLNIDVRKETEDSRLNYAIEQLITFVKGRLNFSTTAANVDLRNLF